MGNAVQSNSIASAFHTAFGIPQIVVGIIIAAIALFVFVGGISRIAKVTETIVPIMACFYIIGSLIVIFANFKEIPYAFYSIVVGAFKPSAVSGGAVGATVKLALTKGVARGLFSNEAGMGSTPHAHAVAKVEHPVEQGFVAMIGVFRQGLQVQHSASMHFRVYSENSVMYLLQSVCSFSHFRRLLAGISLGRPM